MTPSSEHLVWTVPPGNAGACRSQPHSVSLAGHTGKCTRGLLSCARLTPVLYPLQKLSPGILCRSYVRGDLIRGIQAPAKGPRTVPFFALSYLEMCSTKLVLSSAQIQPEAQSTGVPGSFSNPAQHKMHQAEIEWVYFWKHWLVLF